jgi:hypothetical protein
MVVDEAAGGAGDGIPVPHAMAVTAMSHMGRRASHRRRIHRASMRPVTRSARSVCRGITKACLLAGGWRETLD